MLTTFQKRVYRLCTQIPYGKVSTYKAIGEALRSSGHIYRAVGAALHHNPFAPHVPCHRVVCSNGGIGGFATGCQHKINLLKKEGISVKNKIILDFEKKLFVKFKK